MRIMLLIFALGASLCAQQSADWFLQACQRTDKPFPVCRGVKLGAGFEFVGDEIRVVPTTNGYKIEYRTLVYDPLQVEAGRVYTLPEEFQALEILYASWGYGILTRVSGTTLPACPACYAEALDGDGKRALIFSDLKRQPEKASWAVAIRFAEIVPRE